ncbi:DUF4188 domain-containing protein [Paenibacillus sp. TRM 82003]|nr:DUF4188 domain-containing protein [Paenibacillus sp. TRM 82003]MCI3923360.1 DUF4188 domain-containing protein [Paenibacillus sp. TRM 82003]
MVAKFIPGAYTAKHEGPLVVFVIGMHVNRWTRVRSWLPVFRAMPKMLRELYTNKELGFLDANYFFSARGPVMIQYWKSYEQLEDYARNGTTHLEAWKEFNRRIRATNDVGFFHESYIVEPGRQESVYINMPVVGLARATEHVPAVGPRATARRRLGGQNEPAVAE